MAEALIGTLAGTIGEAGAGALVSGAGLMAGGAAADALGLGGGKEPTPVLTDAQEAIDYYKQAAEAQKGYYLQGLNYYQQALEKAGQAVQKGYLDANSTLKPLSQASNNALNEMLKFMGMDPISATVSFADRFSYSYGNDRAYNDIANTLRQAEKIKDPAERAAVKQQMLSKADELSKTQAPDYSSIKAPKMLSLEEYKALKPGDPIPGFPDNARAGQFNLSSYDAYAKYMTEGPMADYKRAMENVNKQQAARDAQNLKVSDDLKRWATEYTDEYQTGYTGDEVTQRLQATPGYQFQMEQGTQAIARSQAARGRLASGNTDLAIQEYGQGLANTTYNQHLDRLYSIVAGGSGATAGIAANQANEGQSLSGLYQAGGLAAMDTYRGIGDYTGGTLMHSGDVWMQNEQFNAQNVNQWNMNKMNQKQSGQNAAMGLAANAMNNQTQQGYLGLANKQFNYGVYQNNQTGAGNMQQWSAGLPSPGLKTG